MMCLPIHVLVESRSPGEEEPASLACGLADQKRGGKARPQAKARLGAKRKWKAECECHKARGICIGSPEPVSSSCEVWPHPDYSQQLTAVETSSEPHLPRDCLLGPGRLQHGREAAHAGFPRHVDQVEVDRLLSST